MEAQLFSRILIAIDGSDLADKGLAEGLELAKATGAEVTIVTVSEQYTPMWTDTSGINLTDYSLAERFEEDATVAADGILGKAAATATAAGVAAKTVHIKNSYPADGIIRAAETGNADLIVIASHGRRGVERLLLGSQAHQVLTRSPIAVLVVK